MIHFSKAHVQLLEEDNTNFTHLLTNIRRDPRFENLLMRIMARDEGVDFNLRSEVVSELATYGVIARGVDGMCEIINPIYLYCILQAFKAVVNGVWKMNTYTRTLVKAFLIISHPLDILIWRHYLIISEISLHERGSRFYSARYATRIGWQTSPARVSRPVC